MPDTGRASAARIRRRSGGILEEGGIEAIYHYGLFLTGVPLLLLVGLTVLTLATVGRIRETNRLGGVSESGRRYVLRLRRRSRYLWVASFACWGAFSFFLAGFVGAI